MGNEQMKSTIYTNITCQIKTKYILINIMSYTFEYTFIIMDYITLFLE